MIGMIEKTVDVKHTHSTMEAVWFYLTSLVVLVGLSTVTFHILGMAGIVTDVTGFFGGHEMHTLFGTGFILVLSSLILTGRKLTSDIFSILLVALGVYLGYETSVLLGLIPVAILTTLKK